MQAYINLDGEKTKVGLSREMESELTSCMIYSVLKAGTHLVGKLLNIFGMMHQQTVGDRFKGFPRENMFFSAGHRHCSVENVAELETSGMKGIYIKRNREDIIESIAESNDPGAWIHMDVLNYKYLNREQRVALATLHVDYALPRIEGWAKHSRVYTTTFERLIGSKGGGSPKTQREEIKNIYNHLNDRFISYCQTNLFGDTKSFRKGLIGEGERNGITKKG